eukprot:TRINITY_DN142_c0_g1::TRINITY_DN142_c0_g1_i1::g.14414::m.14414 TRINITY_DN142_c0_g1::TRINITY_DN142_c0_g1_i1::g.14414  ORF type:complete len:368 (+),score=139.29,sp/P25323/MYLKA_DICDI/47.37/1e-82,Pkinase/PF00069.20/2.1e-71,Pkinase_Tyr/PF07714.12/5.8e-32,Kdo/PF06293.9/3.6e+02,Kdo/PF06293.9/0.0002,Kinase-like/PF14531.1/0.00012,Pox_ser-thr_kin/PF05445.6/0.00043,APH/PF01636.18/89,APH/PF01636.18/0.1,RIO1/PF01163.17/0.024,YrbL-PhoP_reg/PF10707.4/0.058 TRINITY_DN142_c0_g1_i1:69-1106(+)
MKWFFGKSDSSEVKKKYEIGRQLGQGNFARVDYAVRKGDGKEFAIKCISKNKLEEEDQVMLEAECEVLKKVSNMDIEKEPAVKNIIHLEEVFDTPKKLYLVLEYVSGGELLERIVEKGSYSERKAAEMMFTILKALDLLHRNNIVHRDLKPENLLLSDRSENATIKVADFGFSKLWNEETKVMYTSCGTPEYVAPEVLLGRGYGTSCDIWSAGVIFYIMLCGYPPFFDENTPTLFDTIMAGKFDFPSPEWDVISKEAKSLIKDRMLVRDPKKRATAAECLTHPFFQVQLPENTLDGASKNLKRWNARRKFKKVGGAVMATAALARGLQSAKISDKGDAPVEERAI